MKKWYASKTIWVNVLAAICLAVQAKTGFVIDAEAQAAILIIVNLILRGMTKEAVTLALILALAGCSATNVSEYTKELVASKRAFCAILNAGPYGGGTIAAGSPDVSVQVSASGCNIEGANVTRVTVPTGNITITPLPRAEPPRPTPELVPQNYLAPQHEEDPRAVIDWALKKR